MQAAQDSLILTGTSTSEQVMAGAIEASARSSLPRAGDQPPERHRRQASQQVLLQVHVAEATRQALNEPASASGPRRHPPGGATPGNAFFPGLGSLGAVARAGLSDYAVGKNTPDFVFPAATSSLSSGRRDYAGLGSGPGREGSFRTLAKPNLITQSGKEAKFISGGEFPVPGRSGQQPHHHRVQGVRRGPALHAGGA